MALTKKKTKKLKLVLNFLQNITSGCDVNALVFPASLAEVDSASTKITPAFLSVWLHMNAVLQLL